MARLCVICGKRAYSDYCMQHKRRTPLKVVGTGRPIARTSINKVGKQTKKWQRTRQQWLKEHPFPLHRCHYCGKDISESEMTLDHKIPRSRAPELRYDFDNLVPACWLCNGLKASVAHDDYPHLCHI